MLEFNRFERFVQTLRPLISLIALHRSGKTPWIRMKTDKVQLISEVVAPRSLWIRAFAAVE